MENLFLSNYAYLYMERMDSLIMWLGNKKKILQLILGVVIAFIIAVTRTNAQNTEGLIYGKVYTGDNVYLGQLRWGKEEAFWNDHFNASKTSNKNNDYRPRNRDSDDGSWSNFDWSFSSIWDNKSSKTHQFVTQFGDIKIIENYGGQALLTLKDGTEVMVNGSGYNDLSPSVRVLDGELGEVSIKWSRVEKVEFLPTPANLKPTMGIGLFGTVNVYRKGDLTGYIQWDHDERLSTDKLDGDTRDGDLSISFSKIRSIESGRGGSDVELLDGRKFYLTGSNDVNSENRGIIITIEGVGKVDVPWKVFNSVRFDPNANSTGASYVSYKVPRRLSGTVHTYDDDRLRGRIVFDLDEALDIEFLEGKDDELEYRIPFRNIKSIRPKNYNYSQIELRNGGTILLGDGRDVSDSNDGILVFTRENAEPEYISWKKVSKIVFD